MTIMHAYTTPCYPTAYPTLPEHVAAGGYLFKPSFQSTHNDIGDVDASTIDDSFSDIRPAFEVLQEISQMMDARKERERKRAYERLVGAHRNPPFPTSAPPPPLPATTAIVHTVDSASEMQRERQKAYDRLEGIDRAPVVDFSRRSFMDLAQVWCIRFGRGAPSV